MLYLLYCIITKTGNDHKQAQKTTNHQQMTTNNQQTTANHQQMNTNNHQMTTNYQQTTTNSDTYTSNQKADILFLVPAPGHYKDYLDFEKDTQLMKGNCLLLSQYLCGASKIRSAYFGRLSN